MSQIITFEIERTKVLTLDGEQVTVRFTKNKDTEERVAFATNDGGGRRGIRYYSPEGAASLSKLTGQELADAVQAILQQGS